MKHQIARFLNWIGIKLNMSTGIDGSYTYGYGKLDSNGYWEYSL